MAGSLTNLLENIRNGERPKLSREDTELLLAWLNGSAERQRTIETPTLPRPGHDPVLVQLVLYRLEATLFSNGELLTGPAGLGAEHSFSQRRNRFRRLASAFHPDRFPELADWLTERSQAVHRAYAAFKRDPEAHDPVYSASAKCEYPVAKNVQPGCRFGRRQHRKRRFVALAEVLRARFGGDRYLAHKMIGALAVVALLPVLNMVLVPAPGSEPDSKVEVDAGDSVSDFELPVSLNNKPGLVEGGGVGSETGIAAAKGPARETEIARRETAQTVPDSPAISPLLAAARLAMNPEGNFAPSTLPSVDEQLTAMGLQGDTERLYRRMGIERGWEQAGGRKDAVSGFGFPVSGKSDARASVESNAEAAERSGAVSGRADYARRAESDVADAEVADPEDADRKAVEKSLAFNPKTRNRKPETGAQAPDSLAEQVPAASRDTKPETVARPSSGAGANVDSEGEDTVSGFGVPVSGKSEARASVESNAEAAKSPGSISERADHARRAETDAADAEVADLEDTDRKKVTSPLAFNPETRNRKPETGAQAPALRPGSLTLGPFERHPAGALLAQFHTTVQAGNIPGIAATFSENAELDAVRGRNAIADHFRAMLAQADSQRVDLKVVRLSREEARDGPSWRVDAELGIDVQRDGIIQSVLNGRSSLWLDEHSNRLVITRLKHE